MYLQGYVTKWGIDKYKWNNDWKNYNTFKEEDFKHIIQIKKRIISFFEDLKIKIKKATTAKEVSNIIYEIIMKEELFEKTLSKIDKNKSISEENILELKAEYSTAINLIYRNFRQNKYGKRRR